MKKILISIMICIFCLTFLSFAHIIPERRKPAEKFCVQAEETFENEKIQVTIIGCASKKLEADCAQICACLKVENNVQGLDIYQDLLNSLYGCGVGENEVELEFYSSLPTPPFVVNHYGSCYRFNINISNLDNLPCVNQTLNDHGAEVLKTNYYLSNLDEEYAQIIDVAIENAKEKADKILNKDNYEIASINEKSVLYSSTLSDDKPYADVEIQARVEVVFE